MTRRRIITLVIILAIAVGGYFGVRAWRANQNEAMMSDLQTEKIQVGNLEASVGATGTVRANQTVTLSWQTTGTVDEVLAGLGDQIKEGQILANLRQSSLPQNIILAQADLVSAQNALEDLLDSSNDLALAQAELKIARAREKLDAAEDEWDDINYVGNQKDIDKAYRDLQVAYDNLKEAEENRDSISNPNSRAYRMADIQYRTAYNAYAVALSDYNYLTGNTVDEIERAVSESDLELARQELANAEETYQELLNGPKSDDVAAAEARVAAAEAALELARIEAPFDGIITQAEPLPGDNISPGTPAFRVDDLSSLLVDVEVSEVDINRVEVGQPVVLTFDAILATEYSGTVVEVSPVGNIVNGVVNFKVTIEIENPDARVRPGMTAAVNIIVSQLEEVMLVPNRAVRVVNGERVVYTLKNNNLEMVPIELGASADLYSEIAGGDLEVGDDVVLNPPSNMTMFGGPPGFDRN